MSNTDERLAEYGFQPTSPNERLRARLLDGSVVEYGDLKPGQIFQALRPDGLIVDPFDTDTEAPHLYALARSDPEPSKEQGHGWALHIEVGSLADLKKELN